MKRRTLGKSGFRVSEVGLGCWQLGGDFGPVEDERAQAVLEAADAAGINFWDTADVYGAGQSESHIARYRDTHATDPIVATKVGRDGDLYPDKYTKERVRRNIEGSARRLDVESIDLVQLHCVPPDVLEAGDLMAWMDDFQSEGLIQSWGASVETLAEAQFVAKVPGCTSIQLIFNVFRQNAIQDLFPLAVENDVGIIVRLPLASGVLAGKMTADQTFAPTDHRHYNRHGEAFSQGETFSGVPFERALEVVERMRPWVPGGMTMAQMAIRWILDQPAVSTVIAGASRPSQVRDNAAAANAAHLSARLHKDLAELYKTEVEPHIVVPI
jgi:aryl-alcohol dehydrogenase-like predicted oxidoreductase